MTTPYQLKLRGIFIVGDSPENLTNAAGDIFSKAISAINNFFQHLISLFNQEFPPDERDEQIRRWTQGATPYLIGACVLITCLCCWCCLFSCISTIIVGIFNVVWSLIRGIFYVVRSLIRGIFYVVRSLIRGISNGVFSIFRCFSGCLLWIRFSVFMLMLKIQSKDDDDNSAGATDQYEEDTERFVMEVNDRGYFRDTHGESNNVFFYGKDRRRSGFFEGSKKATFFTGNR